MKYFPLLKIKKNGMNNKILFTNCNTKYDSLTPNIKLEIDTSNKILIPPVIYNCSHTEYLDRLEHNLNKNCNGFLKYNNFFKPYLINYLRDDPVYKVIVNNLPKYNKIKSWQLIIPLIGSLNYYDVANKIVTKHKQKIQIINNNYMFNTEPLNFINKLILVSVCNAANMYVIINKKKNKHVTIFDIFDNLDTKIINQKEYLKNEIPKYINIEEIKHNIPIIGRMMIEKKRIIYHMDKIEWYHNMNNDQLFLYEEQYLNTILDTLKERNYNISIFCPVKNEYIDIQED